MREKRITLFLALCLVITPLVIMGQSVQSHFPSQNAVHISLTANITVTFDIDMDPATISNSTFFVYGDITGRYSGTIGYDAGSYTATFDPGGDFIPGEKISVTLTTGVQSGAGDPLIGSYFFSFRAASGVAPRNHELAGTYPLPGFTFSICSADFDGDGDIDLSVSPVDDAGVGIMTNDGSGNFSLTASYATAGKPIPHDVADFNGDGHPDIVAVNEGDNMVRVFINDGSGGFPSQTEYAGPSSLGWITAADFDGDGHIDLATISESNPVISIFPNLGDGSFGARLDSPAIDSGGYLRTGDVDNDGDVDLVVMGTSNHPENSLFIHYNDGAGAFTGLSFPDAGSYCSRVALGDVDGDSYVDIMISKVIAAIDNLYLLVNDGAGGVTGVDPLQVCGYPIGVSLADLDGDGHLDVVSTNWGFKDKYGGDSYRPSNISLLWNSSLGYFLPYVYYELPVDVISFPMPVDQVTADFNNDGRLDVAACAWRGPGDTDDSGGVYVYFNAPVDIVCGDANSDVSVDLGDAVYLINYIFRGGPAPDPLCKGDVNGDGSVNVGDAVYIIKYVFGGCPPPPDNCCD